MPKMNKPYDVVKRLERGWGGHFCGCADCLFRRNTLLTYRRKRVVVSTVGVMKNHHGELTTIGHERWYETMVFYAKKFGPYIGIDVHKQIYFDSPWCISGKRMEDLPDDVDNVANAMHEKVVEEITQKMVEGAI